MLPLSSAVPAERGDAARNRALLLDAARRLIAERGADAVSMDDVAAAAGVGKGTLFRRFGSRAGLMLVLLDEDEQVEQAARDVAARVAADPELARRLADTDAAIIMKLGRTFAGVREALRQAGMLERAVYVERASYPGELVMPAAEVDEGRVPYMSIVVVPGEGLRDDAAGRAADFARLTAGTSDEGGESSPASVGTVHVVGLGPGPDHWLTPQASEVLARVDHVVGYAPYVARVPQREGLTRHASGNSVELDRGRLALDLAREGADVALVSGGDAGVFGMATALFESREAALSDDPGYADVPVEVVPGVTAAHAASAIVGAVLGGDHALVNLSDNLKPWEVLADRLVALASRDVTLALYNPRSRSRPDTLGAARDLLVEAVGPDRVVVVARHVGRDEESSWVTTLGELDVEAVDMGCLVVVGASSTRVTADGRVWTPRSQDQR